MTDNGKFNVIEQRFDKHIVIPDLHGESKLLEKVIDKYHNDDTGFVFLGDLIDKKGPYEEDNNTKELFELIKDLGKFGVISLANHEMILLGSLDAKDPNVNYQFSFFSDQLSGNTYHDYGIDLSYQIGFNEKEELRNKMTDLGHLALLYSITPYYETTTFIATHAGADHVKPWEEQRNDLEQLTQSMACGNYPDFSDASYGTLPSQIFSFENSVSTSEILSTEKIIISGHAHYLVPNTQSLIRKIKNPSNERSILNGQRVRLASQLNKPMRQDLFIWHDWDEKIEIIYNG